MDGWKCSLTRISPELSHGNPFNKCHNRLVVSSCMSINEKMSVSDETKHLGKISCIIITKITTKTNFIDACMHDVLFSNDAITYNDAMFA